VTAADIAKNSQVEIKNPSLVLAHITDEAGSLDMEIIVKEGRGYRMPEGTKKENREIGYIEIDSIFSPVTIVSTNVENTRVGKMTNWDKLILNVKTDGTITPEQAFNEAVKVLVEQFSALISRESAEESSETEMAVEEAQAEITEEKFEEKPVKKEKKEKKEKKSKK